MSTLDDLSKNYNDYLTKSKEELAMLLAIRDYLDATHNNTYESRRINFNDTDMFRVHPESLPYYECLTNVSFCPFTDNRKCVRGDNRLCDECCGSIPSATSTTTIKYNTCDYTPKTSPNPYTVKC